MTLTRIPVRALVMAALILVATSAAAQGALQFRADLKVKDSQGRTGTAKLYIGASRLRMEFPVAGESRPTIVVPKDETQFTISPGKRKYMEMPLGESGGTVSIPRIATMNPANPCDTDRLSDCKRLGSETVNGYATEKWEYLNVDGDKETAWVSTKLRFPIRTTTANGATTEITNIVEGAQTAALFDVPAGFAKVDDIDDGMVADVDPAQVQRAAEMARAAMAQNPANAKAAAGAADPPPAAAGPSPYEGGPGWLLTVTITANATTRFESPSFLLKGNRKSTVRYTASMPLNTGQGPLPGQGPMWFLVALSGNGSAAANAATLSVGNETRIEEYSETRSSCDPTAFGSFDVTTVTTMNGSAAVTLARLKLEFSGSAIWQMNPALTTYSLKVQFLPGVFPGDVKAMADESKSTRKVDHCAGDKVTNETMTQKVELIGVTFEVKDIALPANAAAGIKGSKSIPWTALEGTTTATAEWTITRLK